MFPAGRGLLSVFTEFTPRLNTRTFSTRVPELFTHYLGPGGLRRVDTNGNIQIFNRKATDWTKTQNPVHQRAIDFDSTPISAEEASIYVQRLKEKKVDNLQ